MVSYNKRNLYFDILIFTFVVLGIIFSAIKLPVLLYVLTFLIWFLIIIYSFKGKGRRVTLLCFQITFFVFLLGGTFFSYILEKKPLFDFSVEILSYTYSVLLISQATLYMSYRVSEFLEQRRNRPNVKKVVDERLVTNIRYIAIVVMLISVIPSMIVAIDSIKYVASSTYRELYLRNGNNLPFLINKLEQMFSISFFLYLATNPKKKNAIFPIVIFISVRGLTLITGRRTDFMLAVMVVFFYFLIRNSITPEEKWIGKKEILGICLSLPVLILVLTYINAARSGSVDAFSMGGGILQFFKDQGVSITVIEYGKQLQDMIPKQPYLFGTIIDFLKYNEITQIFFDFPSYGAQTIEQALYGTSFADTISYLVIPYDYLHGSGLGSCYIAETYQSLGMFGVILVNIVYGWVLNFINSRYGKSIVFSAFSMFMLMRIFYAPRSSSLSFISSTFTITNIIVICGAVLLAKRIFLSKIKVKIRT